MERRAPYAGKGPPPTPAEMLEQIRNRIRALPSDATPEERDEVLREIERILNVGGL